MMVATACPFKIGPQPNLHSMRHQNWYWVTFITMGQAVKMLSGQSVRTYHMGIEKPVKCSLLQNRYNLTFFRGLNNSDFETHHINDAHFRSHVVLVLESTCLIKKQVWNKRIRNAQIKPVFHPSKA